MSYDDTFYRVMQFHLRNWGDEFDRNYCHLVIRDMISTLRELVEDESNKGRQNLKVFIVVSLAADRFLEESTSSFNDGMVPASKSSIMELPERREIDEDHQCMDDDDCEVMSSSRRNNLMQKCKVRLRTLDPCAPALPGIPRIAEA
ncbi:hypothetical protein RND71_022565 [Anisodus tanguticus]|uniref:Uncharacterized protein n=1 Tax=Anisodus tanguticus TaxID=243964 RepID=A0AAE1RSR3_9SOLA|nr:hypothetical protein RND71_022565 [Anisodus tanguticus]